MSSETHQPPNEGGEELRPVSAEIKRLLRRGWWLILSCTVAGLAFGLVKLSTTEPTYVASARIYLSSAELPAVNATAQRLADQHFDAQLSMPLAAIVSPDVIDATIQQGNLTGLRTFADVEDPARHLITNLDVGDSLPKRPGTPLVKFYGPDPREAEQILTALVDAYRTHYVQWQHLRNDAIVAALSDQKKRFETEYNEKQTRRAQYQLDHDAAALGGHDLEMKLQQLSSTVTALNQLRLKRVEKEVTLAWLRATPRAESNRPVGLPDGAVSTVPPAGIEAPAPPQRLEQLNREYGPDHHLLREAQARHDERARRQLSRVDADVARISEQMEMLRASLDGQRKEVLAANRQVVELKLIENDLAGIEQLLSTLDDQIRDVRFLDEYGTANLTLLEQPHAFSVPIAPDSTRIVVVPVIVGCLIGILLAYWFTSDNRRSVATPTDSYESSLGVPVLGVVRAASAAATVVPTARPRERRAPIGAEVMS